MESPFNFPLKSLCLYTVTLEDGPAWLRKAFEEAFVWCKGWHKEWGGKSEPNSLFSFLSIPAPPWGSLLPDDLSGFICRAASHPSCRCVRVWGWAWRKRGGYKMREDERKEDFLICRLCEHHHTRLFYWPFPGEGNGNPVQGSCLGNLLERGAWRTVVCGVARVGHDLVIRPPPDTKFSGQQGYQGKQFKI